MARRRGGTRGRRESGASATRSRPIYVAVGVAIVVAVSQLWPDDLEPSTERTAENVVLVGARAGRSGVLWFGIGCAIVRAGRWRAGTALERMLGDPARPPSSCRRKPTSTRCRSTRRDQGARPSGCRSSSSPSSPTACWHARHRSLPDRDGGDGDVAGASRLRRPGRRWRDRRLASTAQVADRRAVDRLADVAGHGRRRHLTTPTSSNGEAGHRRSTSTILTTGRGQGERRPHHCRRQLVRRPAAGRSLYLRLFDNEQGTPAVPGGAWREYGYVHLLRSATSVTEDELSGARSRSGESSVITSEAEMDSGARPPSSRAPRATAARR